MDMRSLYDGIAGAASASRRHSACCSGLVARRCKIQQAVFRRSLVPSYEQGHAFLNTIRRRELLLVGQLRDVRRPQGRGRVVGGRGADNLGCRLAELSMSAGLAQAVQSKLAKRNRLREATQDVGVEAGGGRRVARFRSRLGARERAEFVAERHVSNDVQCPGADDRVEVRDGRLGGCCQRAPGTHRGCEAVALPDSWPRRAAQWHGGGATTPVPEVDRGSERGRR